MTITDPAVDAERIAAAQTRDEWVAGLRALADFIEATPDFPLPDQWGAMFNIFAQGDDPRAEMARIRRLLGAVEKDFSGEWFILRRYFGPHKVEVNARREEVCDRVQVGTETVEEPDPAAPKVTVERPVFEWRCSPLLAGEVSA